MRHHFTSFFQKEVDEHWAQCGDCMYYDDFIRCRFFWSDYCGGVDYCDDESKMQLEGLLRIAGDTMKWISVEDELPNHYQKIIFYSGRFVEDGWLRPDGKWQAMRLNNLYGRATHWMPSDPLPSPPETE